MPNFTNNDLRKIMDSPDRIRNMSVIAHVDHGKSTLTDSLICKAGIISAKSAGDARATDTRADEQERGVTIKSTGVSLYFKADCDGKGEQDYLINLIDSPGHVDFSSEVTAALRVTDGSIVVVDCIEGCAVQTETVLRQSLAERVMPCLFLNKVDRCILELAMEPEDMYLRFRKTVEDVNVLVATYEDKAMGDASVWPEKGTVAFGSGLHGWAFNIERFANIYAAKFGIEKPKMMARLWGDWWFSAKEKKWANTDKGAGYSRGFCQFIMTPISQLMMAIMNDDTEKYEKMLKTLEVPLVKEDRELVGKQFMKRCMQKWINAADTLLTMIVTHLPSPRKAQKYRAENLYSGPKDDEAYKAVVECDPKGPLMMYISKMIPTDKGGRFTAFGRIFSGTVATGQKVRIQGSQYVPGEKTDLNVKSIQRVVLMMGSKIEQMADVPCGNTCGLVGVDQYLLKTGTITTVETAHNFHDMKYSVSPVVRVAVRCKDGKDLPKLVEGLKKLSKSDPLVVCQIEESGEHVIAGCGELHVEICLKDLEEDFAQVPLIKADPVVSYRETCTEMSSQTCLSKSPNKHNRLYFTAEPLDGELCNKIEESSKKYGAKADPKERTKIWAEEFDWDKNDSLKVWCFGPETDGANLVCDKTVGVQYLNEIKEHVNSAFQWASKEGPLCEENMRGCKFNIMDVTMHADSIHRGAGQIMPPCRRVCFASLMTAKPTLQEPIFLVEITCPQDATSGIYSTLNIRRGIVFETLEREGTPLVQVKCHLPVSESFGFTAALRAATSGQAFPQMIFSHWENLQGGDAMQPGKTQDLILGVRKRKGLKHEMPELGDYLDKL
jgi:elongation factor 2